MDISLNDSESKKFSQTSTNLSLTELIEDESNQVVTVVVFVITVVVIIILIFVLAVFIDCRQQKIQDSKARSIRKRVQRKIQKTVNQLPTIREANRQDDQKTFVNHMEVEPSSSHAYVV
ncbi:hypothetical protein ABEB36_009072 [Hypothenemus hampei]|uniref:Uncharacterized protein n=1 Tax=Hypothenemus hampei TaxID=57062 RepID=A0ABD1EP39_HYPHA